MEIRSHRRIRDLVAHTAFQGLDANEIGCVRISMMAGSNTLRSKGRIQMSETSHLQISHIQLATHGRSIQKCHNRTSVALPFSMRIRPPLPDSFREPESHPQAERHREGCPVLTHSRLLNG